MLVLDHRQLHPLPHFGQEVHQGFGPLQALVLRMGQQGGDAGGVDHVSLQLLQHLHGEGDHQVDQAIRLVPGVGGDPLQSGTQLLQGEPGERGVQQGAQQLQLGVRQGGGQAEEFVLHLLAVGHEDGDERALFHHQQVIPGDGGLAVACGQGEGGVLGQLGDDLPGLGHHLVHLPDFQV